MKEKAVVQEEGLISECQGEALRPLLHHLFVPALALESSV